MAETMNITHDLKIWPEAFAEVMAGRKTVEIRKDDRGFEAGDTLLLREWEPFSQAYTGREVERQVGHVLRGFQGLAAGFVALSLAPSRMALLPEQMRQQAELQGLRWVAGHLLDEHARLAAPYQCLCPVCAAAREWVEPHQAVPHPPITPRCPLMAARPQDGG